MTPAQKESVSLSSDKMGRDPVGPLLAQMSWPAILMMTTQALYNVVDSIFVAQLGEEALTGVTLVLPVQLLMISVFVGTGVGVNSLIARRLGARKKDDADRAAGMAVKLGFFNSLIFVILGLFLTGPFIGWYTDDPLIRAYGCTYMRIVLDVSLFCSVEILLEKILQASGDMLKPMIASVSGALLNILLDPIMIFGLFGFPRLEVAGAAIATVTSEGFSLLVAFIIILKRDVDVKIRLFGVHMDVAVIKDIYAVGLPSIIMQAIGSFMLIAYNRILAMEGAAIAVLGIYQRLQSIIFMPVFGLNQGAMPLMAYNYGARNRNRLVKTYRYSLTAAFLIMSAGFLLFQFCPDLLLSIFHADDRMMEIGRPALRIISICFIPAALGIINSTLFQATGHGVYSLMASLIRQCFGILPLAYIFYRLYGVTASWFSFPLAEGIGIIYSCLMLRKIYREEIA